MEAPTTDLKNRTFYETKQWWDVTKTVDAEDTDEERKIKDLTTNQQSMTKQQKNDKLLELKKKKSKECSHYQGTLTRRASDTRRARRCVTFISWPPTTSRNTATPLCPRHASHAWRKDTVVKREHQWTRVTVILLQLLRSNYNVEIFVIHGHQG